MATSRTQTQVTQYSNNIMYYPNQDNPTLEIYLKNNPVYVELSCIAENRFVIAKNNDYVKASNSLQRWCVENIHQNKKLLKIYEDKDDLIKKRMSFYETESQPKKKKPTKLNTTHNESFNEKMMSDNVFRPANKNVEFTPTPHNYNKVNYSWNNFDNIPTSPKSINVINSSIKKRPASADRRSLVIKRGSVIQDESCTVGKIIKGVSPSKKYDPNHIHSPLKNDLFTKSLIGPTHADIQERINRTKYHLYETKNLNDQSINNCVRSFTPINRTSIKDSTGFTNKDSEQASYFMEEGKKRDYAMDLMQKVYDEPPGIPKMNSSIREELKKKRQLATKFENDKELARYPFDRGQYIDEEISQLEPPKTWGTAEFPYEGFIDVDKRAYPDPMTTWPKSNFLLTCDWDGIQKQFSLADFCLYKTYNKIIKKGARKMVATKNSRHIIISDLDGFIKHYTFEENGDIKYRNFIKAHDGAIRAMCLTNDDSFQFTASQNGFLKQWYLHPGSRTLMKRKNWSDIHKNSSSILSLIVSKDDEYLFVGDKEGTLKQFSIRNYALVKKYNFVTSNGPINCLEVTVDNLYLFIGYSNGFLRQVDIRNQVVEKDYGWVDKGGIRSLFSTHDQQFLFVGGSDGNLIQFDIFPYNMDKDTYLNSGKDIDFDVIHDNRKSLKYNKKDANIFKDYGRVMDANIYAISGTDSNSYLWLVDESGLMKVLDIGEQIFIRSTMVSSKAVYCMCLVHW